MQLTFNGPFDFAKCAYNCSWCCGCKRYYRSTNATKFIRGLHLLLKMNCLFAMLAKNKNAKNSNVQ